MNTQNINRISGAALAMIAAGLAGHATAGQPKAKAVAGSVDLVQCAGVNACKGHNDCSGAKNSCKGEGSCKGQGFVMAPAKACADMGGKTRNPKATTRVATSTLVHCMGANVCKGHNDCKTAANACKGHGECKGQGFIALPAATCSNVGGTAG